MIAYKLDPMVWIQAKATKEPIRLDLKRSIDNLRESFSSGEITSIIDSNVQNNLYSGYFKNMAYPIEKPIRQRNV